MHSLASTLHRENIVTHYHDSLYPGLCQSHRKPRIQGQSLSLAFHPKWSRTSHFLTLFPTLPHLLKPPGIVGIGKISLFAKSEWFLHVLIQRKPGSPLRILLPLQLSQEVAAFLPHLTVEQVSSLCPIDVSRPFCRPPS